MHTHWILPTALVSSLLVTMGSGSVKPAIAVEYPPCRPPGASEYLLLVVNPSAAERTQVNEILPASTNTTLCNYLGNPVLRVGGFTNADVANSWAQYLTELGGLQAFVARPSAATAAGGPSGPSVPAPQTPVAQTSTDQTSTDQTPIAQDPAQAPAQTSVQDPAQEPVQAAELPIFQPRPLATGYAVLVSYFNRPEVAADLQQALGSDVGLVAYGQRPYLLAAYTADLAAANAVLQTLSDRNFLAMMVDSRRVMLLTTQVKTQVRSE